MSFWDFFKTDRTLRAGQETTVNGIRVRLDYSYDDEHEPKIRLDLLSLPSIAQALSIKANDIAQLPLYVYQKTAAGRQKVNNELAYRLFYKPNDYSNGYAFWHTVSQQMLLGDCFVRMSNGQFHLLPVGLSVRYTAVDGSTRYAVLYSEKEVRELGLDPALPHIKEDYGYNEVLHFRTSVDESGNTIPLRDRFKAILGLGSDVVAYMANVYNRGGVIAGYLTTDTIINDDQKLIVAKAFKKSFWGSRASTQQSSDIKISALDNGWKFQSINLSPQEMMVLESKKDFVSDVAKIFNLPEWKLGLIEHYKYASAEAAQRDYLQSSLNPDLCQIEREINSKVFDAVESEYFYVEFYRDKIIQIDSSAKASIINTYIQSGVTSKDEARAMLNLDAVPGGSIRQIPVNTQSAEYTQQAEQLKLEKERLELQKMQKEASKPDTIESSSDNSLRATVGALTAVQSLQQSYYKGELPREAVIGNVVTMLGLSQDEAAVLFPEKAPAPPEAAEAPPEPTGSTESDDTAPAGAEALRSLQASVIASYGDTLAGLRYVDDEAKRGKELAVILEQIWKPLGKLDEEWKENYVRSAAQRLPTTTEAYEVNRAINAAVYAMTERDYGASAILRWKGGKYDNQTLQIGGYWEQGKKHPPLDDDNDCFLEKIEKSDKK